MNIDMCTMLKESLVLKYIWKSPQEYEVAPSPNENYYWMEQKPIIHWHLALGSSACSLTGIYEGNGPTANNYTRFILGPQSAASVQNNFD